MERDFILNFIAEEFKSLSTFGFTRMTIALYGKIEQDEKLKHFTKLDQLFVYDVRLPRVFTKVYPLSKMNDGILQYGNDADEVLTFSKSDFNYEVLEPYQGEDIRSLDFDTLALIPYRIENMVQMVIICYGSNASFIPFSKSSLTKLYHNLSNSFHFEFLDKLNQNVLKNSKSNYFVKNGDSIFVPDKISEEYKELDFNAILDNQINHIENLGAPYEDSFIYYLKDSKTVQDLNLPHYSMISKFHPNNDVNLLYIKTEKDIHAILDVIDENGKIYIVTKDTYLFAINEEINLKKIRSLLTPYFPLYFILLDKNSGIKLSSNLTKVVDYLEKYLPNEFNKISYTEFLKKSGNDLLCIENVSKRRFVNHSISNNTYPLVGYLYKELFDKDNYRVLEEEVLLELEKEIQNKENEKIYVCMDSNTLRRRKLIELIKKCKRNNQSLAIIVHLNRQLSSITELLYLISNLDFGVITLYVDSSLYFSLDSLDIMTYAKGIYVTKEEFESIEKSPREFANVIVSYFFNKGKEILFEETNDSNKDKMYTDDLIYYVSNQKGKL